MDTPELANLNQIELDSPLDQPERGVMARDLATGSILVVPRDVVRAMLRLRHGGGRAAENGEARSRSDRAAIARLLHSVQHLRQSQRAGAATFNPLFIRMSLFSVAPWQRYLTGLAKFFVGPAYFWLMATLLLTAVWLGIQSDWAIIAAFQGIFSPEALLTFGIAAPLLKIFHELGHVLAATRFGTRVAQAGVLFIALFPIPFVDCSDADVSANRLQRVVISLAGLFTDLLLGVVIFIAWHFTTGDFLRSLLGNLFVYLTLNSVLFNANPLVKLDGYFAMIDLVRYRNLSQDGGRSFKGFQIWLGTLGRRGTIPTRLGDVAILAYAALSFVYRIYIIGFIAYSLLPRYMGLGAVMVVWGMIAMFLSPLARSPVSPSGAGNPDGKALWGVRLGFLAILGLSLVLVRVPVQQDIDVTIDAAGHYALTVPETGRLGGLAGYGPVTEGTLLAELDFQLLREQLAERQAEHAIALRALEAERDGDPLSAATARQRLSSLQNQVERLESRLQGETLTASATGVFVPLTARQYGANLVTGTAVGALYPDEGSAIVSGRFPERYVHYYRGGVEAAEMRVAGHYYPLGADTLGLQERVSIDEQSGQRLYVLQVRAPLPASDMFSRTGQVRLTFRSESLWQRLVFHATGLFQNLQDARLSEVERQLGTP